MDLIPFDYPAELRQHGHAGASRRLREIAKTEKPDVMFAVLRHRSVSRRVVREISRSTDTTTVNWYCDDHWQFPTASRYWTPAFNHVVTTAGSMLPHYLRSGWSHVILSQWAVDERVFRPTPGEPICDVSFVGQPYGERAPMIEALRRAGIDVKTFGQGWPEGRVSQARMVELFGRSRISLNFTRSSHALPSRLERLRHTPAYHRLSQSPGVWRVARTLDGMGSVPAPADRPLQVKGRVFEVPACGGFLLTQHAEDLPAYLTPGREVQTFANVDELIDRCRYYLKHDDVRDRIAQRGHHRTLEEHTWPRRLTHVFDQIGRPLPTPQRMEAA